MKEEAVKALKVAAAFLLQRYLAPLLPSSHRSASSAKWIGNVTLLWRTQIVFEEYMFRCASQIAVVRGRRHEKL
eukprot:2469060-Amphidinium_carterae.2